MNESPLKKNSEKIASSKERSPYQWDFYSDQPYPIKDKSYKKRIRIRAVPANLKLLFVNAIFLPLSLLNYFFLSRFQTAIRSKSSIGLCVNLDKEPSPSPSLVSELGVRRLSLRIPLSDVENIDSYVDFIKSFSGVDWMFVVLQDREHIDNEELCAESFEMVFSKLHSHGKTFQIGNAINRTKWGFSSVDEYLSFFKTAQNIRDAKFPEIDLLGSSVIDFEVYALIRSLWHFFSIRYDGVASLLYVDRRGAPENTQFIFDLIGKINFFWAAIKLSPKTKKRLIISETNWPIEHTKPYAPALGDVWVSENDYANYMLRFYLLAIANGRAECIYWHQLIAPGYGLIDNRDGVIRKREAYFLFKNLCDLMNDSEVINFFETKNYFEMVVKNSFKGKFHIVWMRKGKAQKNIPANMLAYDAFGKVLNCYNDCIEIGESPIFFFQK